MKTLRRVYHVGWQVIVFPVHWVAWHSLAWYVAILASLVIAGYASVQADKILTKQHGSSGIKA